ncbi:endocuticle structural glycoprotein SgAbd-4-like [Orussus abietinus]|uniref:endocuticle structural glycoprotein SgAbd-4-like n=1 Tax=Orussus abietinus TaxID=222816 RepID=UPI0006251534|nr:endocuticle structural glycoprotein SgAbd-4-like [Orussus abietinus]
MRTLVFSLLVCLARGQEYFQEPEKLVSESRDVGDARGHYSFTYETEGGILQKEIGSRKYAGTPDETQLIQGSVQYNAPDGTPIALSWTADEFGTQVFGSHIPTPPPIPPAIQRALDWLAKQPSTTEHPSTTTKAPVRQNFQGQQTRFQQNGFQQNRFPQNGRN